MWTHLKPPCWRRCGAVGRTSQCGVARERFVRAPATVRSSSTSPKTYYDILGIEATASADDIKSAFRKQAKLVHPDVSKSTDSEEEFKQLKEAYDVLSDAEQRAEYDGALRRAARRRSSGGASASGGRRVVIVEDDPWGFGATRVEVVMEGFEDDSDDDDDDGDGFLDELEFMAWAAMPGNMRSSYQSSWQANSRKARRGQKQAAAAAMQEKLSQDDKVVLLTEMPPQVRAAAQQVFGARLQSLNNLEELAELVEAVMEMDEMGIQFEFINDEGTGGRGSTTRGSRRQGRGGGGGAGGGAKARRPGGGSNGRRRRT
ncbi:hypothetical protein PLESTB_000515400 [Pleodorina starrii]|uniref:J domain-containing protein n=1 Tax=Pleodorina starrii TaxID=330485 RepID=A0A9W6BGE6_9CHLO|nr:hypothetical protein PLESTM_000378300 [Pleodorina starrii]GLC51558.1 hypothetical protein PLESTB_000515400 [Pleodorina starrii]GLC72324.1 hypothetical protein PLESTF_001235400 [Pleodorina starrii]